MDGWAIVAENKIREAVEKGVFDHLRGKGQRLDLSRDPFEDPLAPTYRRILRDNGATHPLIEARRALEEAIDELRTELRRARQGSAAAWDRSVAKFRRDAAELNRSIKLNNLTAPVPSFALHTIDVEAEIRNVCGG